jgi:predicted aconitase with swiveling domain
MRSAILVFAGFFFGSEVAQGQVLAVHRLDSVSAGGIGHSASLLVGGGNGHKLVAGVLDNAYSSTADIGVALIDESGSVLRQKRLSRGGADYATGAFSFHDSGFILSGISSGYSGNNCPTQWTELPSFSNNIPDPCATDNLIYNAFAIRFNHDLDTVWTRDLGQVWAGRNESALDSSGNLRVFFESRTRDSVCTQVVALDGGVGSRTCFIKASRPDFRVVTEPGGTFLVAGSHSDSNLANHSWFCRLNNQGQAVWSRNLDSLSVSQIRLLHRSSEGQIFSYWSGTDPEANGLFQEVEIQVKKETIESQVLLMPEDIHVATGRYKLTDGRLLIYPALSGSTATSVALLGLEGNRIVQENIDPWFVHPITIHSVHFGNTDELWFAGNTGNRHPSATSQFVFGRMRLDQPPRFPDALKSGPTRYKEDDSIKIQLSVQDDFFSSAVKVKLTDENGTRLYDTVSKIFAWVPGPDWYGDTVFHFTAIDTVGQNDSLNLRISVQNVNDTPYFEFPGMGQLLGSGSTINQIFHFGDADNEKLKFELIASPPGLTLDDGGRVKWEPASHQTGFFPLAIQISDSVVSLKKSFTLWVEGSYPVPVYNPRAAGPNGVSYPPDQGIGVILHNLNDTDEIYVVSLRSDNAYPPTYSLMLAESISKVQPDTNRLVEVEFFDGFVNVDSKILQSGQPVESLYNSNRQGLTFKVRLSKEVTIHTHHLGAPNSVLGSRSPTRKTKFTRPTKSINVLGQILQAQNGAQLQFRILMDP